MSSQSLHIFHPSTSDWFISSLGTPTAVQEEAWPAIATGQHTLVSAPTGTGKTLSAFLVFIDRLKARLREGTLSRELHLIYVSPLKSLASDIRENLRRPLDGISKEEEMLKLRKEATNSKELRKEVENKQKVAANEQNLGIEITDSQKFKKEAGNSQKPKKKATNTQELKIAIRTGDTPQNERQKMIKSPPHILITTPESLYLMLTSKSGRSILHTARAIIIDELHAMIDSKRGAHLMLSIARLDKLCGQPLQRIGLSATIKPLTKACEYLSPDPVTIVAPSIQKDFKLLVTTPLSNDTILKKDPVWQDLAKTVYEHCINLNSACTNKVCINNNDVSIHSVIAFVEGRMYAEKLAYYVNQLGGEGFARTHHGSLSKEQRLEVETALRNGHLRLLCATSSMELGIDVGDIDAVIQIGCPRSISSTLQRLGRAGHSPGRTSIMYIYPRSPSEALYCGMTANIAKNRAIEHSQPPKICLDVLSQHLVSMATGDGYDINEVMEMLHRAYPFREVTKENVKEVLCMLSGDYEHARDIPVRPRILYDRLHERVHGDAYSRMLAISAGGTIPDKGLYSVKTENGVKLGELDEEFVYESRVGDKFLLGTFAWQIVSQEKDAVIVSESRVEGARLPYWKGEWKGRGFQTGIAFGKILHSLYNAHKDGTLLEELCNLGLDHAAANSVKEFLGRQIATTNILPDDQNIIVEHFKDVTGKYQMMVHSVFGRRVNAPLALLVGETARQLTNRSLGSVDEEDGFLLYPYDKFSLPKGLLYQIPLHTIRPLLEKLLLSTPLFQITFRYNAARALMMGVKKSGRQPLWMQRLRSAEMLNSVIKYENHPLFQETKRECLEDHFDLSGVEYVLQGILSGTIKVHEMYLEIPSPMSLPLQWQAEASMMYDAAPTTSSVYHAAEDTLKLTEIIPPTTEQLEQVSLRAQLPDDENKLHSLLMIEGDFIAGELPIPIDWLESLAKRELAKYIEPGLWIAAEQTEEYENAFFHMDNDARGHIIRRALRYRGAMSLSDICERYVFTENDTIKLLTALCQQEEIVEQDGLYYHAKLYHQAQRATIQSRRKQIKTVPPERYAALLANRIELTANEISIDTAVPKLDTLGNILDLLCDQEFAPNLWESILLPGRMYGYRPGLLDTLISKGSLFFNITKDGNLCFHQYKDIDWDVDLSGNASDLEGKEKVIYEALLKRGASFVQSLTLLLDGITPYDALLSLLEKGLVCTDSFIPIRHWITNEKSGQVSIRNKIITRMKTLSTGRWELARPIINKTMEQQLDALFDKVIILCRETAGELSFGMALETLRIMEYTGYVRRGYFIEGLSGAQFIREKDFDETISALEQPREHIVWLPAIDPLMQWGKSLSHMEGRSFLNVAGTVVALHSGRPAAVFERQGKVFRVFDDTALPEILSDFVNDFKKRRLFPALNRLVVKQYDRAVSGALLQAGFSLEIQDYVLYR